MLWHRLGVESLLSDHAESCYMPSMRRRGQSRVMSSNGSWSMLCLSHETLCHALSLCRDRAIASSKLRLLVGLSAYCTVTYQGEGEFTGDPGTTTNEQSLV